MADIAPNRQPRGNADPRRTAKRVGPSGDGRAAAAARKLIDIPTIERAFREILIAIGEDPDREGLRKTPARIARMYAELFAGLRQDAEEHLQATFDEGHHEMVVLRDIRSTACASTTSCPSRARPT